MYFHIIMFFVIEQQLYVGVLKHLPEHMASQLLSHSNLSLGVQSEFYYNWSKWHQTVDQPTQENAICEQSKSYTQQLNGGGINYTVPAGEVKKSDFLNLKDILSSGPYGPGVLSHYEQHHSLNVKARKLLVDAFLHYCASTGISVSKAACKSLSMQIQHTFEGEIAEYYYVHRSHGAPLGKLYNKFHNWKNSIRNATETISDPKAKKQKAHKITYEESQSDQDHKRALTDENLGFDGKFVHWKSCVATRLNSFNKSDVTGINQIIEIWPMYKDPDGYKLV